MGKNDVWMPLYWADLLADTQHLSREDFGSYMLLIGAYWRRGEALLDDDGALRRICRCESDHWQVVRPVMASLFTAEGGVWRHKRIDAELAKARHNREVASERGRKGASKKWLEHSSSIPPSIVGASKNDGSSPSSSPSPVSTIVDTKEKVAKAPAPKKDIPTPDEAKLHGEKIGLPLTEILKFMAFYESKGWMVGKSPMRQWRSSMAGWKVRWEADRNPSKPGYLPAGSGTW